MSAHDLPTNHPHNRCLLTPSEPLLPANCPNCLPKLKKSCSCRTSKSWAWRPSTVTTYWPSAKKSMQVWAFKCLLHRRRNSVGAGGGTNNTVPITGCQQNTPLMAGETVDWEAVWVSGSSVARSLVLCAAVSQLSVCSRVQQADGQRRRHADGMLQY